MFPATTDEPIPLPLISVVQFVSDPDISQVWSPSELGNHNYLEEK
jgi:hypothetical protein